MWWAAGVLPSRSSKTVGVLVLTNQLNRHLIERQPTQMAVPLLE